MPKKEKEKKPEQLIVNSFNCRKRPQTKNGFVTGGIVTDSTEETQISFVEACKCEYGRSFIGNAARSGVREA